METYKVTTEEYERLSHNRHNIGRDEYKKLFNRWRKLYPIKEMTNKIYETLIENKTKEQNEKTYMFMYSDDYNSIKIYKKIYEDWMSKYREELNEYHLLVDILTILNHI